MDGASILHLLWTGEIGGAERAVYQLVREQRRRGLNVGVLFGRATGLYANALKDEGCPVMSLGARGGTDVGTIPAAIRSMKHYDLHHFHTVEPLTLTASVLSGSKARVFTQRAGLQHGEANRKRLRRRLAGLYIRHSFHAWCGNNPYAAETLTEVFRVPRPFVDVIYNGIEFELLQPRRSREEVRQSLGLRANTFVIGTTAFLKGWKRVHLLLEAGARLGTNGLSIVIVGDGPDRARLEGIVDQLGIKGSVVFTGMQDHVADFVSAMDAFVLPSNEVEAFGNAVIEAMALGVPSTVFRDSPGIAAHIESERTGFVVEDVEGLVRVLGELRSDRALAERIGVAGAASVRERYSIARSYLGNEEAYRKALSRRTRGSGLKTVQNDPV